MPSPLELWSTALKSPLGIEITTNDRHLLKQRLWRARQAAGNPEFDKLCVILPKEDGKLWIAHKDADER